MATNPDIETDIPSEVYAFFRNLNRAVDNRDPSSLHDLYENQFETLTKNYYVVGPGQFRAWPALRLKQVSDYFKNKTAELIYSFLFYKHLFTDRSVKLSDAKESWATFSQLFRILPSASCELPSWMLWDIFDEFVFQMTVVYQKRFAGRTEWSLPESFRLLESVVEMSGIMTVMKQPEIVEELTKTGNTQPLCGFFAIITKSKVNVLLGDYYAALSDLQPLDVYNVGRSVLQKVTPANISLLYHVGFSYLMLHRYEDAGNSFRKCLSVKLSGRKFSERVQLDAAYMFVCARVLGGMVVTNINSFLDSRKVLAFEDEKESLRSGDEERFREVFDRCSPKFLSVPPLSSSVKGTEGKELQARMFRRAVQQQQEIIKLRGYFGVYQNTKMSLLETLLESEDGYAPLFALKMRSRQIVHDGESADLISGEYKVSAQFDCIVSDDNVEVVPCQVFGGTETKLFNKIKNLNRDQQLAQRKQQQLRQRKDQGEQRPNQQRRQNRDNRGGPQRKNQPRRPQQQQQQRPPFRRVEPAASNLFNRNET